jgi:hypothetical protein
MKYARASSPSVVAALLLSGVVLASGLVHAATQWKWRDAGGAIQYSDRPPPPGTPEANILARPAASVRAQAKRAQEVASQASAPALNASSPKSEDPELEARRKKAEAEEAAKRKADEEKFAKQKADNCVRARSYQRTLQDGIRIARTDAKGEREILDDKGRAEEMQRTQDSIQSNCK